MRIALIHNAGAGDGSLPDDHLARLFREAGHEVELFGKRPRDVERAMERAPDVLAVAGGDGTVARAVTAASDAGLQSPLLILPVGTSNNIARSLGICRPIDAIVRTLDTATPQRFDVWHIDAAGESKAFVEAAGVGFIGAMLEQTPSPGQKLVRAIRDRVTSAKSLDGRKARGVARLIREQPLHRMTVIADDDDLSGEYLAVEAMNIRQIGPRVVLAPGADSSDGRLDLVLLGEDHREQLAEYVGSQAETDELPCGVTRRVRSVEISWPRHHAHVDDTPVAGYAGGRARIGISGGVMVLGR